MVPIISSACKSCKPPTARDNIISNYHMKQYKEEQEIWNCKNKYKPFNIN